ncbi:hypothetical protein SVAN01_08239 [Stagonosporopsis vannaccii]|nr:hypothetical protein SVAN01_08239 [Stagonosporopsis vannaccii]
MLYLSVLLSGLYAISLVAAAGQKCYSLTGTELDNTFTSCNSTAKHSGCCATNRTTGADICLDNGLCMATENVYMGTIWQPGCTDSTGKATQCPQLCPGMNNNFDGLNPVPAWNIQTCDFGIYCCRAINDRRNCCNNSTAPRVTTTSIGAFELQTATASSTSISSAATATDSPSDLEANLTSTEDVCKDEKHKTAVVGGAVGGILGTTVVGMLGLVYWMSKREQRQRKLKEHYEEQFAQTWAYRKAMAASTTSMRTEAQEEFMSKSSGS